MHMQQTNRTRTKLKTERLASCATAITEATSRRKVAIVYRHLSHAVSIATDGRRCYKPGRGAMNLSLHSARVVLIAVPKVEEVAVGALVVHAMTKEVAVGTLVVDAGCGQLRIASCNAVTVPQDGALDVVEGLITDRLVVTRVRGVLLGMDAKQK